jgi:predicted heme/steroid binding protein
MKVFAPEELAEHDGVNSPAYLAYRGKVYDVSSSVLWRGGGHQALHVAGVDLTEAMDQAPHGEEFLARFPVVGTLKSREH